MLNLLILLLITLFTGTCLYAMASQMRRNKPEPLSVKQRYQLGLTGVLAFFADTLGIGSFAVTIALAKYCRLVNDQQLPGLANGCQVLPGALEALFFLQVVDVDSVTLISLVLSTCLGGVVGASVVARLSQQAVRLVMICVFPLIIMLLLSAENNWLTIGGSLHALRGAPLLLGCIGVFISGALAAAGIGLFAMIQAVLFVLGMSPLAAFPIMTTAGALQQPLTTFIYVKKNKIPLKQSFTISLFGLFGVMLALPLVSFLSGSQLHYLLIAVLTYNTVAIANSFLNQYKCPPEPATT